MSDRVLIGHSNDFPVRIGDSARQTHMHVLGLSRVGKSKFLEHLIREDLKSGHGLCLIDPHGGLYADVLKWLSIHGLHQPDKIHLINPADGEWSVGFNPLAANHDIELSVRIDAMADACAKVWGGEDLNQTPLLARCLQVVFGALASRNLTIAEWQYFANWSFKDFHRDFFASAGNDVLELELENLMSSVSKRQFDEFFSSLRNRLYEFTKSDAIRRMIGQNENVIDFRRCMDEGHIVLVNLSQSGRLSPRNARVIGALLTNAMYLAAFSRDEAVAKRQPFYCYIDECARFLTQDVANALDETAKFGLHMVLSHQRLGQLVQRGNPELLNAVWAGAQVKMIFNCDDEGMAEPIAKHLFRKEFDLTRMKGWITQPVVVGHDVTELSGYTESRSRGGGHSDSHSTGQSSSSSDGVVMLFDDNEEQIGGYSESVGAGFGQSYGRSYSQSFSEAFTQSHSSSEALMPILEERSLTSYSLEDQLHDGIVAIRSLKQGQAFLYHREMGTLLVETPWLSEETSFADEIDELNQASYVNSWCTHKSRDIEQILSERVRSVTNKHDEIDTEDYFE